MPESQLRANAPSLQTGAAPQETAINKVSAKQASSPTSNEIERRRALPPVIVRQIEQVARMPGIPAYDYFELFTSIVEATGAKDVLEYIWVLDITVVTMEIKFLRKMKLLVIERKRQARLADLAFAAKAQTFTSGPRKKFEKTLDTPCDDAQAFLDSIAGLSTIEAFIDTAEMRRDKALRDIERRQKAFADSLRLVSGAVIDGTTNSPKALTTDDIAAKD